MPETITAEEWVKTIASHMVSDAVSPTVMREFVSDIQRHAIDTTRNQVEAEFPGTKKQCDVAMDLANAVEEYDNDHDDETLEELLGEDDSRRWMRLARKALGVEGKT